MIIEINRYYIGTSAEHKILINSDYIMRVESCYDPSKGDTRIIYDSCTVEGPDIIYTNDRYVAIKNKLTKQRNAK